MINRLFFFIRKDPSIPFYYETTNYYEMLKQHLLAIDPEIGFSYGVVNDLIHYYKFTHPSIEEFKAVTQNMYFDGDLKQEFKKCMRYTKDKKIAFALAAVREDYAAGPIQRQQYYNVKPSDQTFIDATYSQKVALGFYDAIVGMDELVFTINFFDYEHNVKHVETRLVKTPDVWERVKEANDRTSPNFMVEKHDWNTERGIIEGKSSTPNVLPDKVYKPVDVREFLEPKLKLTTLDLSL